MLERVVDEVLDDLLHLHAVAAERGQVARRPPRDEPVERRPRESAGLERREDVGQRERLDPERQLAGLEPGDVERGAEEVDELDRLPLERGRHLALFVGQRAERPFAEQARVADERVQRRTQIVRHGAERVALQAGDACQSSGLTRVCERHPGQRGEGARQVHVRVGEAAVGQDHMQRADERARVRARRAAAERQDQRGAGPGRCRQDERATADEHRVERLVGRR